MRLQVDLRVLRAELAYEEPAVRTACPLQPYLTEAAASCHGGGDPMQSSLQSYALAGARRVHAARR